MMMKMTPTKNLIYFWIEIQIIVKKWFKKLIIALMFLKTLEMKKFALYWKDIKRRKNAILNLGIHWLIMKINQKPNKDKKLRRKELRISKKISLLLWHFYLLWNQLKFLPIINHKLFMRENKIKILKDLTKFKYKKKFFK